MFPINKKPVTVNFIRATIITIAVSNMMENIRYAYLSILIIFTASYFIPQKL